MPLLIGIDNGGVCSIHSTPPTDLSLRTGHHSRDELDMPLVVESLHLLQSQGHILSLESFSGRSRALKTFQEIESRFPQLFSSYHFTKDKKWKADICGHLGLDVMIDDIYEVVVQVATDNPTMVVIWFQGDPSFDDVRTPSLSNIRIAKSWVDVIPIIESITEKSIHTRTGFLIEKDWNKRVYNLEK